jgi:hypothetical protein
MSISYVQPIFAPDEKRLERNLNSLCSFGDYTKKFSGVSQVLLGGWSPNEDYWKRIREVIADKFSHVPHKIIKFDRNYGKAVVVNELSKQLDPKNKYMLTADSDILFTSDVPNMFVRLVQAANVMTVAKKREVGMIGLNQLGHNCHLPCCYENQHVYTNTFNAQEKIVWPTGSGGIAGGSLMFNIAAWRKIGGYRVMGCYAGDDAYSLIDLLQNGYSVQMADTIGIIHPQEADEEYAKWKVMVCQRDSGVDKNNIEAQIAEAEEFWKNHK